MLSLITHEKAFSLPDNHLTSGRQGWASPNFQQHEHLSDQGILLDKTTNGEHVVFINQPSSSIQQEQLQGDVWFPNDEIRADTESELNGTLPTACIDVDSVLLNSFKYFLRMNVNEAVICEGALGGLPTEHMFLAGGLQQYLIKNMKKEQTNQQPRKGAGSSMTTFHDLPDSLQLEIFSYLSAQELSKISQVCRHWYCIASDDILWQQRLDGDMPTWAIIGHSTYPDTYRECNSDRTNKEIYLRCSPEVNRLMKQVNVGFHHLSNILRAMWPKKTPRVAMFGPGLESSTSGIARKILEDTSGLFKVTGMFPGQFEGVGSGFTMKMNNSIILHLMTLYTSTKEERESRRQGERLQHSRLLAHVQGRGPAERGDAVDVLSQEEDSPAGYEVKDVFKDLCRTLDAFIFVVDAGAGSEAVSAARAELSAMVDDRWVEAGVPVVVLSCMAEAGANRTPCVDVARLLQLSRLNRPWQVHDCMVDTMAGVSGGMEWVIEQARRR